VNHSPYAKHGHRWSEAEMRELIGMWLSDRPIEEMALRFGVRPRSIYKIAGRLRRDGVPLPKRKLGHVAGRHQKPWTQEEVEYLVRRRNERANAQQIAEELDRTHNAVSAMISKLRQEGVNVRLLGHGTRRLWSAERLRAAIAGRGLRVVEDETAEAA
jgi:biotin operon repressor